MTDSRTLGAVSSQFALACSQTALYYMMTLHEQLPGWFYPHALLLYAPLIYVVNRLFLRREPTMRALCILNVAAGLLFLCAYLRFEGWKGVFYLVFTAAFAAWLTVRGCRMALNGLELRGTLLTLDGSFVCLLFLVAYTAFMGTDPVWNLPAVCGFAAAVVASATCRSSQSLGLKGWLVLGGAFSALFLVMWLVVGVAAAPAGQGLVSLWNLLARGISSVQSLLIRGLTTLLTLLPSGESGDSQFADPSVSMTNEPLAEVETNPLLGTVLAMVILGLLIALFLWMLRKLGKIKLSSTATGTNRAAAKRERVSLWRGLHALLTGWVSRVRLRIWLWKNRNTAKGCYFLLVRRCRRGPWHKRPGETPREFLLRLARSAPDDVPLADALANLAKEVDLCFYSGRTSHAPLEYTGVIQRKMGAAVGRQYAREWASRLQNRLKK